MRQQFPIFPFEESHRAEHGIRSTLPQPTQTCALYHATQFVQLLQVARRRLTLAKAI